MKMITLRWVRGAAVERADSAGKFAAMVTEATRVEESAITIDRNPRTLNGIGNGSLGACAPLDSLVRIGSYRIRTVEGARAREAGDKCDERCECGDPREVRRRAPLLGEARMQHCFAD